MPGRASAGRNKRGFAVPHAPPLTGLAETIAALLAGVAPAAPGRIPLRGAEGRVLAAPLATAGAVPPRPVALREGWAVASEAFVGASPYAPVFPAWPLPWVTIGDVLPAGADCVLSPDSVSGREGAVEITGSAAPGEGVRRAGEDAPALCRAPRGGRAPACRRCGGRCRRRDRDVRRTRSADAGARHRQAVAGKRFPAALRGHGRGTGRASSVRGAHPPDHDLLDAAGRPPGDDRRYGARTRGPGAQRRGRRRSRGAAPRRGRRLRALRPDAGDRRPAAARGGARGRAGADPALPRAPLRREARAAVAGAADAQDRVRARHDRDRARPAQAGGFAAARLRRPDAVCDRRRRPLARRPGGERRLRRRRTGRRLPAVTKLKA